MQVQGPLRGNLSSDQKRTVGVRRTPRDSNPETSQLSMIDEVLTLELTVLRSPVNMRNQRTNWGKVKNNK